VDRRMVAHAARVAAGPGRRRSRGGRGIAAGAGPRGVGDRDSDRGRARDAAGCGLGRRRGERRRQRLRALTSPAPGRALLPIDKSEERSYGRGMTACATWSELFPDLGEPVLGDPGNYAAAVDDAGTVAESVSLCSEQFELVSAGDA